MTQNEAKTLERISHEVGTAGALARVLAGESGSGDVIDSLNALGFFLSRLSDAIEHMAENPE